MNRDNASALAVGVAVVLLIAGFGVYFNSPDLNKKISLSSSSSPTSLSSLHLSNQEKDVAIQKSTTNAGDNAKQAPRIDKSQFKHAPDLAGISNYINSKPFKIADLKGKVVLVDFWTYSCINCIRTIPYLNAWNEKYSSQGLVIIGVHTPEFDFEKNPSNVQNAVEKFGIKYPVVQDNDRKTWDAYQNRYWPHKYLVDDEGFVRYDHIGEGNYEETEKVIQSLLQERAIDVGINNNNNNNNTGKNLSQFPPQSINSSLTASPPGSQSVDFGRIYTPELYFGYQYARAFLGNPQGFVPGKVVTYSLPTPNLTILNNQTEKIMPNTIYLSGDWLNNPDSMELKGGQSTDHTIVLKYSAKSVNIVAGGKARLYITEDGHSLNSNRGADSNPDDGSVSIDGQRLYNIANHKGYAVHTLVINVEQAAQAGDNGGGGGNGDFQAYTFTFG
jgi:thiol-disulfide isomerase/thioredoxin